MFSKWHGFIKKKHHKKIIKYLSDLKDDLYKENYFLNNCDKV